MVDYVQRHILSKTECMYVVDLMLCWSYVRGRSDVVLDLQVFHTVNFVI